MCLCVCESESEGETSWKITGWSVLKKMYRAQSSGCNRLSFNFSYLSYYLLALLVGIFSVLVVCYIDFLNFAIVWSLTVWEASVLIIVNFYGVAVFVALYLSCALIKFSITFIKR